MSHGSACVQLHMLFCRLKGDSQQVLRYRFAFTEQLVCVAVAGKSLHGRACLPCQQQDRRLPMGRERQSERVLLPLRPLLAIPSLLSEPIWHPLQL